MLNDVVTKNQNISIDEKTKDFFIGKSLESERDEETGCKKYIKEEMNLILDFVMSR